MPHTALVVTSISSPNAALASLATGSHQNGINFIVIGDISSPADFSLDGCDFWNIKRQETLTGKLAPLMPHKHYARKNLGYLIAARQGADIIIETDDDNFPLEPFWNDRIRTNEAPHVSGTGWINVYNYFSDTPVWPRGFPLEYLHAPAPAPESRQFINCPIQQGLADDNPDVDAVYRLTQPLPIRFRGETLIALGLNAWSPFNSQNTTWFREAFPLLYLPYYCSFRMTDIWRSFVAQRICWANDWHILFHSPTVRQERNEHDLLHDFSEEIPGYLNNAKMCSVLQNLELQVGTQHLAENMRICYRALIDLKVVGGQEIVLLDAWLHDLENIES